ncbi:MAG: hypothetical protein WBK91_07750 [Alphaproteobacteria bacterium]
MQRMAFFALMIVMTGFLSACGVKPPHVDPPANGGTDTFPRTYPNPREP